MAWGGATPALLTNGFTDEAAFADTIATGSVSPTSGAMVLLVITGDRAGGSTSVSSIALGGTLTMSTAFALANDGTNDARSQYTGGSINPFIEIWWGVSSGGTGAITATMSVGCPRRTINAFEITSGFSGTPIAQCASATATTTTTPSGSYGSTPTSTSLLISALFAESTSATSAEPGSSWTELSESVLGNDHNQVQYADGDGPGTTYNWTGLDGSPSEQAMTAIEIAAVAAASSSPGIEVVRTIPGVAH